jgi:hypothetical protein
MKKIIVLVIVVSLCVGLFVYKYMNDIDIKIGLINKKGEDALNEGDADSEYSTNSTNSTNNNNNHISRDLFYNVGDNSISYKCNDVNDGDDGDDSNNKHMYDIVDFIDKGDDLINAVDFKTDPYAGNNYSQFKKKYDYICFWDKTQSVETTLKLKSIINYLAETHYMSCVLVLLDSQKGENGAGASVDTNTATQISDLPLIVHPIPLEEIKDYYYETRFVLVDDIDFKTHNAKLKIIYLLLGIKLGLPYLCHQSFSENVANTFKYLQPETTTIYKDEDELKTQLDIFLDLFNNL